MDADRQHSNPEPHTTLRVLVADDEPLIRTALRRLLEKRGHRVHEAPDAFAALEVLRAEPVDAVLVDMRMPGDGTTVLDWLREQRFGGMTILMTGELAVDAPGAGEEVHRLQKPFPFPSVVSLLEEGVRR
ncbi:MAG TPA: response regulator [Longimicrobiales bacterium]|nr:response regulator [Longimicrobiales bacterium]